MKHFIPLIISIMALSTAWLIPAKAASLPSGFYVGRSVLSEGNWVKVGVDKSGIYEISYDTLLSMGFRNPAQVAVFGRGARMMSENFLNEDGNPAISNDLNPVSAIHRDGKLIFYGIGPENFSFDYEKGFVNNGTNIYSNRGYYFLTDNAAPQEMDMTPAGDHNLDIDRVQAFIWHEKDLVQNLSNTGRLFWGERFNFGQPSSREWNVLLNGIVANTPVRINCDFYAPSSQTGTLQIGFRKGAHESIPAISNSQYYYSPVLPGAWQLTADTPQQVFYIDFNDPDNTDDYANLDYWVMTYTRTIPSLKTADGSLLAQESFAIDGAFEQQPVSFRIPGGSRFMAMDVSDPASPHLINITPDGSDGIASFIASCDAPRIVVFDPARRLLNVNGFDAGYEKIANQNLHGLASEGAEFLIITIPALRGEAERLADIHRSYDNIRVIVATVEEIYNEFSDGVPDPMAYRSLARMLYSSGQHKLRNILLFGPMNNDMRGVKSERDPFSTIIAFQSNSISLEKGAFNVNDFYGYMDDVISTNYEVENLQVGVGVLPCAFASDARRIVNKIEKYIDNPEHAYTLNGMLNVGGLGDDHTHDQQAIDIGDYINISNSSHLVVSTLAIDAYGARQARDKMLEYFNCGKGLVTYFGHGSVDMLGKDKDFFSGDHIGLFRNTRLPFMLFAGCILTNFDRGQRGIAESMVLSSDHGLIGSFAATRDTWSGQNMDLMRRMLNRMYKNGPSINDDRLTDAITIGEVYSRAKTDSKYANELAYHLICDPALIIPVANRRISYTHPSDPSDGLIHSAPGGTAQVSGNILDIKGKKDASFNGTVVLKLLEPSVEITSSDLETGNSNTKPLKVTYADYIASEVAVPVKAGEFVASVPVPDYMARFNGKVCYVLASAYDPRQRIGAGARTKITIDTDIQTPEPVEDTTAPAIEVFEYDPATKSVNVVVSDNQALDMSQSPFSNGFYMTVDNRSFAAGTYSPKNIEFERPAYSKNISLSHLNEGSHSARITVRDAAGNSTEREIIFLVATHNARLTLIAEQSIVDDQCRFSIEGGSPDSARLIISDINGNYVVDAPFRGNEYIWNRNDNNGNPLPPGLYKAFVLETGNPSGNAHSDPIDIPLI